MNKNYLSEAEEVELRKIAKSDVAIEALRKLLLEEIYSQGTLKEGVSANPLENYAFFLVSRRKSGQIKVTDEEIGRDLCAVWEGINLLENGLKELANFREVKVEEKDKTNPAR